MRLVDRAATWDPVPDDRPGRVWLPAGPVPPTTPTPRPDRPPGPVVLTLSAAEADDLPRRLDGLLARADVRAGDEVTVDLAGAASASRTGLALLLSVLWRRVGPDGDVRLVGGSPGLRAQLASLDIEPRAARAAVLASPPAPLQPVSRMPAAPAPPLLDVPAPRRPPAGEADPSSPRWSPLCPAQPR